MQFSTLTWGAYPIAKKKINNTTKFTTNPNFLNLIKKYFNLKNKYILINKITKAVNPDLNKNEIK